MLRIIKLTITNLLLLFTLYTTGSLLYHGYLHVGPTALYHYGFIVVYLISLFTVLGIVLCCLSYKKHRIGNFNIDIFTTIYLFLVFMMGFLTPGWLSHHFSCIGGYFPLLGNIIARLGESSIAIYEVSLALAFITYGLTIGEHKQKYYE